MKKPNIVQKEFYGQQVWVNADLADTDEMLKDNCLCWHCGYFFPDDREKNCTIANIFYNLCVSFNMATPPLRCPKWKPIK